MGTGPWPEGQAALSSGQALGNFPQTYTHVGLIAAALSLNRRAVCAPVAA